jgi:N-acetylmuramoyl-L-alanine amidase
VRKSEKLWFDPFFPFWFDPFSFSPVFFMNRPSFIHRCIFTIGLLSLALCVGCSSMSGIGKPVPRKGDEIVAAGQFFHTGTRVVLWMDPGGYDAYRVERRFSPIEKSDWETSQAEVKGLHSPNRYSLRENMLTPEQIEQVRGGGWDLPLLKEVVDQFVIHYDAAGTSRQCFKVLQDDRGLSVHFLLDVDGTVYQTLDLKERAWHASTSNSRSVGVEIANLGAYGIDENNPFEEWYKKDSDGRTLLTIPARFGDGGVRTRGFVGHPARPEPVTGDIQGRDLVQYDFTPQQYKALIKLTASLCKVFPKITCAYPADASGHLITRKLPEEQLKNYRGVLGHYHIQTDKVDPGPAFQWDRVVGNARRLLLRDRGLSEGFRQTTTGGRAAVALRLH